MSRDDLNKRIDDHAASIGKPAESSMKDSVIKAAKTTACFMGIAVVSFAIGAAIGKAISK